MRLGPVGLAIAAVLTAVELSGCGLHDPYPPHEPTGPPREVVQSGDGTSGPLSVVRAFAHAWCTWDATTLAATRRALAEMAAGGLSEQLRSDARQATREALARVSHASSRGQLLGAISQANGRYVVVLNETASVDSGRAQRGYHVYLATTAHTGHGWRVTRWQPTN